MARSVKSAPRSMVALPMSHRSGTGETHIPVTHGTWGAPGLFVRSQYTATDTFLPLLSRITWTSTGRPPDFQKVVAISLP